MGAWHAGTLKIDGTAPLDIAKSIRHVSETIDRYLTLALEFQAAKLIHDGFAIDMIEHQTIAGTLRSRVAPSGALIDDPRYPWLEVTFVDESQVMVREV